MNGKSEHPPGKCQRSTVFSGLIGRGVLAVAALFDYALDHKTGTAEVAISTFPDTDNFGGEVPVLNWPASFVSSNIWLNPIVMISVRALRSGGTCPTCPRVSPCPRVSMPLPSGPVLLRDNRAGLVLHVGITGNDHHEFVPQLPGLFEIEEVARVEDVERAGGNNAPGGRGTTSRVQGSPSAVKQRQSSFRRDTR